MPRQIYNIVFSNKKRFSNTVIGQVGFDNFNKLCRIYQVTEKYIDTS